MTSLLLALYLQLSFLPPWLQLSAGMFTLLGGVGTITTLLKIRKERHQFLINQATLKAEEKATLEARLLDYKEFKDRCKLEQENTKDRFTGFSQQLERVAEKSTEEARAINEKFSEKFGTVHMLSDKVSTLQLTVTNTASQVDKLETRMDTRFTALDAKLDSIILGLADLQSIRGGRNPSTH